MTLEVDGFGNVLKSATVGYGRRYDDPDSLLTVEDRKKQKRVHVTYTENRYTNPIIQSDSYRTPLLCETLTYELLKVEPNSNVAQVTNLFRFDEMVGNVQSASDGQHDLPYEQWKVDETALSEPSRRLIEHVRQLYYKDDLSSPLPLGILEPLGLSYETYKLAFMPGLLKKNFIDNGKTNAHDLANILTKEGGYLGSKVYKSKEIFPSSDLDGQWWIPSGRSFPFTIPDSPLDPIPHDPVFAKQHFYLPQTFQDPFGHFTRIRYDKYDLLVVETRDPLGNIITVETRDQNGNLEKVENDYRVMQPHLVYDPNGNGSEVTFDTLGMVVGTALVGKRGENKGDSLKDFKADLEQSEIDAFFNDPKGSIATYLLQKSTTRIIYDVTRYDRLKDKDKPVYAVTLARETHASDSVPNGGLKIQVSFSYSDGFGREIQKKIQAEPGPIVEEGPDISPRWVGSGWTIYNNKENPIKKYEPFFSATHNFEFAKIVGVSSTMFYDPLERVVATLHPNHTYEKVVFDPWRQVTWDVNDTVLQADPKNDPDVGDFFRRSADTDYLPTWHESRKNGQQGAAEQSAAQKAAEHAKTPTVIHFDTLGRTFLTIADNGADCKYPTRVELDIEGNQRTVIDAPGRTVMEYDYDMIGNRIRQDSMEAGTRWVLNNAIGKPIRTWDSRGFQLRMTYDALQRPVGLFVTDTSGAEFLAEKTEYGESKPDPETTNHRLKPWKVYDGAGVLVSDSYDFKGNLVLSTRQLLLDYKTQVDWAQNPQLDETETFTSRTLYDALNRPIQIVAPHSSRTGTKLNVTQPVYNEANLLERVEVWLEQNAEPVGLLDPDTATQHTVKNIDYNAKGQREFIEYGNGVRTQYEYDQQTFRLTHLFTTRGTRFPTDCSNPDPCADPPKDCPKPRNFPCGLQNLHYTYDPGGNITAIRDDAQQTIYFDGQVVKPHAEYTYDAIYRLIEATGREHIGQVSQPQTTWNDRGRVNLAHPNDGQKMRNYFEFYEYDEVGNILRFDHKAHNGNWIRNYEYNEASLIDLSKKSNRLSRTVVHPNSQQPISEPYTYDPHGNMTSMLHLHLQLMEWDFEDQLHYVEKGTEKVYYVYDAAGQRVRKVVEKNNGALIEERIYLGGFEIFRRRNGSGIKLERETLHIMGDEQRIAMVETRTIDTQNIDQAPRQLVRYLLGNHLGSASLELSESAHVISYEENYPYGSTSYQAVRSQTEVSTKRYRYTGKERDEESGLYYYGARYYAPWLGRWCSADPLGLTGSVNLFEMTHSNPMRFVDKKGMAPNDVQEYNEKNEGYSVEVMISNQAVNMAQKEADKEVARSLVVELSILKNRERNQRREIHQLSMEEKYLIKKIDMLSERQQKLLSEVEEAAADVPVDTVKGLIKGLVKTNLVGILTLEMADLLLDELTGSEGVTGGDFANAGKGVAAKEIKEIAHQLEESKTPGGVAAYKVAKTAYVAKAGMDVGSSIGTFLQKVKSLGSVNRMIGEARGKRLDVAKRLKQLEIDLRDTEQKRYASNLKMEGVRRTQAWNNAFGRHFYFSLIEIGERYAPYLSEISSLNTMLGHYD
jgi:RHS repeat-associated protein